MANKQPKVYQAKISDFNQDPANANAGTPRGNALIELSLREHGAGRSLLVDENWGQGTHVHGWSCTPTKDMVFYTLGITPAEPGYATARIAPRLSRLAWAKGSVPTPHGLIYVEATRTTVTIDSPVAVVVDLPGQTPLHLAAGKHVIQQE